MDRVRVRHRLARLAGGLLIAMANTAAGAVERPIALVTSVTGSTHPALSAMTEIPSRARVTIDPGESLTFLLYSKCKLITADAGTLQFGDADFTTTGQVTREEDAECPERIELIEPVVGAGEVPGVTTFRSFAAGAPDLRLRPDTLIVFGGPNRDRVTAATLSLEGRPEEPLMRYSVSSHQGIPPYGLPIPMVGKRYTLRLTLSGQARPLDVTIVGSSGRARFAVVRIN